MEEHVAKLMRLEIVALANAVDDVAAGRYTLEELDLLAAGLDQLARVMRGRDRPVIVEGAGSCSRD